MGAILAANNPGDPGDPDKWSGWALLLPHILVINPAASADPDVRWLAGNALFYLLRRGDTRAAHALINQLHREWARQSGREDHFTLRAAIMLATTLQEIGQFTEARRLYEDTLPRLQRAFGDDASVTLTATNNLGNTLQALGDHQAERGALISWYDSGNAFLHGTSPTTTVIDPDGTPNNILQENLGSSVKIDWSFSGPGRFLLTPTVFTVRLYAESIGPGPEKLVGAVTVPGSAHTPGSTWNFTATIAIPAGSLPANGPGASGVYRLTAVIANSIGSVRDALAGFVEGPVIEMRSP